MDRAWHDSYVPVVFLIAIVVVLVAIFFAATGRGGEMAYEPADHAPLDLGPVSSADIALLRPPTALWGYNMQVTDAALDQIARAMRDRDVTIAYLQEQLEGHERNGSYTEPRGAHARQAAESPPSLPGLAPYAGASGVGEALAAQEASADEVSDTPEVPRAPELSYASELPSASESPLIPGFDNPPEFSAASENPEALEFPEALEPSPSAQTPEPPAAPRRPQTTLVLRASGPKAPAEPGPHDPTQPSPALRHDEEPHAPAHPSATPPPDETPGPQGAFDTHGWWAEQKEAAREEQAQRRAEPGQHDDLAAVEEEGW